MLCPSVQVLPDTMKWCHACSPLKLLVLLCVHCCQKMFQFYFTLHVVTACGFTCFVEPHMYLHYHVETKGCLWSLFRIDMQLLFLLPYSGKFFEGINFRCFRGSGWNRKILTLNFFNNPYLYHVPVSSTHSTQGQSLKIKTRKTSRPHIRENCYPRKFPAICMVISKNISLHDVSVRVDGRVNK